MSESSCRWSLKLRETTYRRDLSIPFMMTTKRKFESIELIEMCPIDAIILDLLQKHGTNVIKLMLTRCVIDDYTTFAALLESMPNLKHIVIHNTKTLYKLIDVQAPPEQYLPELQKLKTLEIDASDFWIFKCFRRAKLKTIEALNFAYDNSTIQAAFFEEFLSSQKKLTTLIIDSSILSMTSMMFCAVPFQLIRLSLIGLQLNDATHTDYHNLLRLLQSQANALRE